MSHSFSYTTEYVLDKAHFLECYDQSISNQKNWRTYFKALLFFALSVLLFISKTSEILAYLFMGLSILEVVSLYFQRSWWVTRQMFSKAANHPVTLNINQSGIQIKSDFVEQQIYWDDMDDIQVTDKGLLISHKQQKSYLPQRCLSVDAIQFITAHRKQYQENTNPL